jgi:hypothetical protein
LLLIFLLVFSENEIVAGFSTALVQPLRTAKVRTSAKNMAKEPLFLIIRTSFNSSAKATKHLGLSSIFARIGVSFWDRSVV